MKFLNRKNNVSLANGKLLIASAPLAMHINLDKCLGSACSDEEKQSAISLIKSIQGILAMDDGVPKDFEIKLGSEGRLMVTDNLMTALIVLRHVGLLSCYETKEAAKKCYTAMKAITKHNNCEEYRMAYLKAKEEFMDSADPSYQDIALPNYFNLPSKSFNLSD